MEGYKHSIPVPQNYRAVAKVIKSVNEDGLGLKYAIYGDKNQKFNKNNQRNLAMATKILEKLKIIEHILRTTQILLKETNLNPWLARVLIYELVWRKDLEHGCKPIQTVMKYKNEIRAASETYKEDFEPLQTEKVIKPRYVRINTFKKSTAEVIDALRNDGYIFIPSVHETYNDYLEAVSNLTTDQFLIDFHIKDMLVFSADFQFIKHQFYNDGIFVLQDKASCLAPLLLDPPEGAVVLDMCAAPGMKTNYLANLVGLKGKVYAVEIHQRRFTTLCDMMRLHGLENVHCMHGSCDEITGEDLPDVEYILLDPSCSGSGMVNRITYEQSNPDRLNALCNFQIAILRHALTKFPNVKRVAYSTCSIHAAENEVVVTAVLKKVKDFRLVNLQEKLRPNWNNFGLEEYGTIGTSCLYSSSETDFTNGFFVAIFERIENINNDCHKRKRNEKKEMKEATVDDIVEEKQKKKKKKRNETVEEPGNKEATGEEINIVKEIKKEKKRDETFEESGNMVNITKEIKRERKMNETYEESANIKEETVQEIKKEKTTNETVSEIGNTEESTLAENSVDEKKKKKKHRIKADEKIEETINIEELNLDGNNLKNKKKEKNKVNETVDDTANMEQSTVEKNNGEEKHKKTKKMKSDDKVEEIEIKEESILDESIVKEKKKKKKADKTVQEIENIEVSTINESNVKEKKKKRKIEESANIEESIIIKESNAKEKKKKTKTEETGNIEQSIIIIEESNVKEKKKKKTKDTTNIEESIIIEENNVKEKKKKTGETGNIEESVIEENNVKEKKKKKTDETVQEIGNIQVSTMNESNVKEKKKKRKTEETANIEESIIIEESNAKENKKKKTEEVGNIEESIIIEENNVKEKKKKKRTKETANIEESIIIEESNISEKKKKKTHKTDKETGNMDEITVDEYTIDNKKKTTKRKAAENTKDENNVEEKKYEEYVVSQTKENLMRKLIRNASKNMDGLIDIDFSLNFN